MKRRNVDAGKPPRRPTKRSTKFADSIYGSSFVYVKCMLIWVVILISDFILEFRFEYIWPFWLFVQSVYETFKYQGWGHSFVFVVIAVTSDIICLLFIPIQYLFFMASTYVWIHYVWHTEKGFCLPTAAMWIIIMYIEVTLRLRDLKSSQLHIDLCRPFAAHCIGHPVVTLGIGFKSYIFYRIRLRTQRLVRKENSFYYELLNQALPRKVNHTLAVTDKEKENGTPANGIISNQTSNKKLHEKTQKPLPIQDSTLQIAELPSITTSSTSKQTLSVTNTVSPQRKHSIQLGTNLHSSSSKNTSGDPTITTSSNSWFSADTTTEIRRRNTTSQVKKSASVSADIALSSPSQTNKSSCKSSPDEHSPKTSKHNNNARSLSTTLYESDKQKSTVITTTAPSTCTRDFPTITHPVLTNGHVPSDKAPDAKIELISTPSAIESLEATISKLKSEISVVKRSEIDLKSQIDALLCVERFSKSELHQLRKENESLQTKVNTMATTKHKDKLNMQTMEKRLKSEVDNRESIEKQLFEVKKQQKKEEEETASRAAALALSNREKENFEALKKAKKDLETEMDNLRKKLDEKEKECSGLKKDVLELQVNEKSSKESETLMSALEAMQEKNMLLEQSLSAETRLKLDLFSALGDVKRQLELAHALIYKREAECGDLKARMADFLSVMPDNRLLTGPHYSANFLEPKPIVQINPAQECPSTFCPMPRTPAPTMIPPGPPPRMEQNMVPSHHQAVQPMYLDPNAAIYNPNTSGV